MHTYPPPRFCAQACQVTLTTLFPLPLFLLPSSPFPSTLFLFPLLSSLFPLPTAIFIDSLVH